MISDNVFSIIKKSIRNKKNVLLIFILSLLILLLNLNITFIINFYNFFDYSVEQNIGFKSISTYNPNKNLSDSIEEVKSIENVLEVYNARNHTFSVSSDLNYNGLNGRLSFLYGTENIVPKSIIGENFENIRSGETICPYLFYPDSSVWDLNIDESKAIAAEDLLGYEFNVKYNSYTFNGSNMIKDHEITKQFKIVGFYDSTQVMNLNNECYITAQDMEELQYTFNPYIQEDETVIPTIRVVVDKIENLNNVLERLVEMGYVDPEITATFDLEMVNKVTVIAIAFMIIIISSTLLIFINYIIKKIKSDLKYIGILRACGYTKSNVIFNNIMENAIIVFISFIISMLLFIPLFYIFKVTLLKFISYIGYKVIFNLKYILYVYLFLLFICISINGLIIKKYANYSISKLIKEDN